MLSFAKVYRKRADERHFCPPLLKKIIHGCMQKNKAKNKQSGHTNVAKYPQPKEAVKMDNTTRKKKKKKIFMSAIINIIEDGWWSHDVSLILMGYLLGPTHL